MVSALGPRTVHWQLFDVERRRFEHDDLTRRLPEVCFRSASVNVDVRGPAAVEYVAVVVRCRLAPPRATRPTPARAVPAPVVLAGVAGAGEDLLVLDIRLAEEGQAAAHHADDVRAVRPSR